MPSALVLRSERLSITEFAREPIDGSDAGAFAPALRYTARLSGTYEGYVRSAADAVTYAACQRVVRAAAVARSPAAVAREVAVAPPT